MPGDELRCADGRWIVVQEVMAGAPAPVYNMCVAEYHTYFVGSPLWGFAVWVHNMGVDRNCGASGASAVGGPPRPDLFRTGNTQGPSPVRVGTDITPDATGNVHPTSPPTGLSTYDNPGAVPTKGRLWRLPGEQPLPPGLSATPDAPPPGHVTIGPTQSMSLADFLDLLGRLPWVDTGVKLK